MKRNKVRLTESQLHQVIKESVKRVIKENGYFDDKKETVNIPLNEDLNPKTQELFDYIRQGKSVDEKGNIMFSKPKIMTDAWVIHFTDNGDDLAQSHGFTFGTNDFDDLPGTADGRDYPEHPEKGFDFAFLLTNPSELYAHSDDAFIFRASGILCQHNGELTGCGYPMRQFIFWCDDTILHPYYRICHKKTRWNGRMYDEYTVMKNGETYLKTYNEYGDSTIFFNTIRDAIQSVIADINGNGTIIKNKLRMQRDFG